MFSKIFFYRDSVWKEIKVISIGVEFHSINFVTSEVKNMITIKVVDEESFYPLSSRNHKPENISNFKGYLKSKVNNFIWNRKFEILSEIGKCLILY